MANGLISMQHRQTPAEARALNPKQTLKEQKEVNQFKYYFCHVSVYLLICFFLTSLKQPIVSV
jgi:hypothetical protein